MDSNSKHWATFKKILNVTSGNFLEQYDFFLFGFYATYIAAKFFHSENEYVSLMMTFTVFAAGFLMRPLGAIFLGAYVDKVGRRKGLIVTLSLMAIGTILITFVPGYETIGIIAPILVVIGRLLQGFSAGVESGGVSIYLAEIATDKNRGFITSWQSGSQQIAVVFAALLGYWLNTIDGNTVDPESVTVNAAQVAGFKTPAKLLRELLAQLLQQLATVLGALATQHFGGQALAHRPVQAGQFGIHRTGQALAAPNRLIIAGPPSWQPVKQAA